MRTICFVVVFCINAVAGNYVRNSKRETRYNVKPNIILVMVDDQDQELGSMNYMKKTVKLMRDSGATFANSFVTTPMCCPSRSSMLTGMYVHNHHVLTNNDNCSSIQWQQVHEPRTFGKYLSDSGYRTGYFGKYLNEYNGDHIPPGWDEWFGLIKNTRYYNYSINFNGKKIRHGDNYSRDYLTDIITNKSLAFFRKSKEKHPVEPIAMVLSMPAPHGPEDAAPQYQHLFENITTHRTPSWNFAPSMDKEWLLQRTNKMSLTQQHFTNILQQKRLQTLQSVDDAMEKIFNELYALNEDKNTYVFYTSDHGYHLGQFGLAKGKGLPYDFDVRVPLYVRGPHIQPGLQVQDIVLNIDLAPTLLDIAKVGIPPHMDGKSYYKLLVTARNVNDNVHRNHDDQSRKKHRNMFLIEKGKTTSKKVFERINHELRDHKNNAKTLKQDCLTADNCPGLDCENDGANSDCEKNKLSDSLPLSCNCFPLQSLIKASNDDEQLRQLDFLVGNSNSLDENCVRENNNTFICNRSFLANLTVLLADAGISNKKLNKQQKALEKKFRRHRKMRHNEHYFHDVSTLRLCACDAHVVSKYKKKLYKEWKVEVENEISPKTILRSNPDEPLPDGSCYREGFECARMDNEHWKVPPFWEEGTFCFCPNAHNNTYWCLRIIDEQENALYCEFITGYASYYNMRVDPYQLRNAIHDLPFSMIRKLHRQLEKLMQCQGADTCTVRAFLSD